VKVVGVIGGMSSVASAEYYRLLNLGINERLGGHSSAEMIMVSVDFAGIERCIQTEDWDTAAEILVDRALRLQSAGAEFVLLATNTMHRVAPQIEAALEVPFVHIVDVVADAALAEGITTLGLLGTAPVMEADFYRDRFAARGIRVLVPGPQERAFVHRTIFDELTHSVFTAETRGRYEQIVGGLSEHGAGGVVLGCTEISLLISGDRLGSLRLYDSTALHVERAVHMALG
jgi:aspartate racemase